MYVKHSVADRQAQNDCLKEKVQGLVAAISSCLSAFYYFASVACNARQGTESSVLRMLQALGGLQ